MVPRLCRALVAAEGEEGVDPGDVADREGCPTRPRRTMPPTGKSVVMGVTRKGATREARKPPTTPAAPPAAAPANSTNAACTMASFRT